MSKSRSTDPHCRIGKVVYKHATNLAVFPNPVHQNAKHMREKFQEFVDHSLTSYEDDMSGFFAVVWDNHNNMNSAYQIGWYSKFGKEDLPKVINTLLDDHRVRAY